MLLENSCSLLFFGGGFCAFKNHEHFCPLLITINPFIPVNWLERQRQVNCEATKHTCRSWCFARFQCKGPLLQRTDAKYNITCIDSWVDRDNICIYTLSGNDRNIAATTVAKCSRRWVRSEWGNLKLQTHPELMALAETFVPESSKSPLKTENQVQSIHLNCLQIESCYNKRLWTHKLDTQEGALGVS